MKILAFYKRHISPLLPPSCRFYPTCSQYAELCFRFDTPLIAFIKSAFRILRCNKLFAGGLEYPTARIPHLNPQMGKKIEVAFWLIKKDKKTFYIIKRL